MGSKLSHAGIFGRLALGVRAGILSIVFLTSFAGWTAKTSSGQNDNDPCQTLIDLRPQPSPFTSRVTGLVDADGTILFAVGTWGGITLGRFLPNSGKVVGLSSSAPEKLWYRTGPRTIATESTPTIFFSRRFGPLLGFADPNQNYYFSRIDRDKGLIPMSDKADEEPLGRIQAGLNFRDGLRLRPMFQESEFGDVHIVTPTSEGLISGWYLNPDSSRLERAKVNTSDAQDAGTSGLLHQSSCVGLGPFAGSVLAATSLYCPPRRKGQGLEFFEVSPIVGKRQQPPTDFSIMKGIQDGTYSEAPHFISSKELGVEDVAQIWGARLRGQSLFAIAGSDVDDELKTRVALIRRDQNQRTQVMQLEIPNISDWMKGDLMAIGSLDQNSALLALPLSDGSVQFMRLTTARRRGLSVSDSHTMRFSKNAALGVRLFSLRSGRVVGVVLKSEGFDLITWHPNLPLSTLSFYSQPIGWQSIRNLNSSQQLPDFVEVGKKGYLIWPNLNGKVQFFTLDLH